MVTELIWFDRLKERIYVLNIFIFIILLKHEDHLHSIPKSLLSQKMYTFLWTITLVSQGLLEDEWPPEQKQKCKGCTPGMFSLYGPLEVVCLSILGREYRLAKNYFSIWNLSLADSVWLDLGWLPGTHQSHSPLINCTGERIRME